MAVMKHAGVTYSNGNCPSKILAELNPPGKHGFSGTSRAKLRKDAAASWNRMVAEVKNKTGMTLTVVGWNRTRGEQNTLFYQRYTTRYLAGRPRKYWSGRYWYLKSGYATAAVPGTSNHGWGLAVDIKDFGSLGQFNNSRRNKAAAILKKHGWTDTEGRRVNEPWHWVYSPSKDKAKKGGKPAKPRKRKPHRIHTIRSGDRGDWAVALWQRYMKAQGLYNGKIDKIFGAGTKKATKSWQRKVGLKADGVVARKTWYRACQGTRSGKRGARVEIAQRMLGLTGKDVDGIAGSVFVTRTKQVQRWLGVKADGINGPNTIKKLLAKG